MDKCILLCANCHRKEHFEIMEIIDNKKEPIKYECIDCNIKLAFNNTRCTKCDRFYRRRNIPTKDVVLQDLNECKHNMNKIGRKYNVNGKTVKNWCIIYQIDNK